MTRRQKSTTLNRWITAIGVLAFTISVVGTALTPASAAAAPKPLSTIKTLTATERSRILHAYNGGSRNVRFTFDDCFTNTSLASTLKTLRLYNTQAIFFLTGECNRQHPTFIPQIRAAGHLVGNHSTTHPSKGYLVLSDAQITAEIRGGVWGNTNPPLCRAPGGTGSFTVRLYNVMARAGCRPVYWTVDTQDWTGVSAATIRNRVIHGDSVTPHVYAGGVVLMHGVAKSNSYKALPDVLHDVKYTLKLPLYPLH